METLKIGQLYEIEGKLFILCASEFNHSKHNTPIVRYYFRKPTFEDGQAYSYTKLREEIINRRKKQ